MTVTHSKTFLLPALLAAGTGIGGGPAAALELGDVQVQSTLGQPLRASIAYALAPHEELAPYCISLAPAVTLDSAPTLRKASVSIADNRIVLTGATPMREPLLALRLDIDCPYTPKLLHEYTVFVDPAVPVAARDVAAEPAPGSVPPEAVVPKAKARPIRPVEYPSAGAAKTEGSGYQVQRGDSLSVIAQRLERHGVPLWDAVDALFAANPDAFIDGDPNRLMAGTWLSVPDFSQAGLAAVPPPTEFAPAPAETAVATPAFDPTVVATTTSTAASVDPDAAASLELQPGDLIVDGRALPAAVKSPSTPIVRITHTAVREQPADRSLWWMIGGGFLLLGGLLYFAIRSRFGVRHSPAREALDNLQRRATDTIYDELPVLEPVVADDYDLDDNSPTSENLVLDADLEIGTGFDAGSDMMVAEDFGFDTSADLDLELPAETGDEEDKAGTDVIPPLRIEESMILESEVLPDDDDYDMSVILDATKVPDPVAVTERDLKAVVISGADDTRINDNYTVSQEVDYQVLEQDYEEELTATQALNLEIGRAAAELADRLDAEIRAESVGTGAPSSLMAFSPLVAGNDDDAGDLEVTAAFEGALYVDDDAQTALLPSADDELPDDTIETAELDSLAR